MVSADRLAPFCGWTKPRCLLSEQRLPQLPHRHHILPQTMKNPNSVALGVKDCPPPGLPCDYTASTRHVPDLLRITLSGSLHVDKAVRVLRTLALSMPDGHAALAIFAPTRSKPKTTRTALESTFQTFDFRIWHGPATPLRACIPFIFLKATCSRTKLDADPRFSRVETPFPTDE